MMRFDPSLFVSRLVIEANGRPVYDEGFNQGLNIIRGEKKTHPASLPS